MRITLSSFKYTWANCLPAYDTFLLYLSGLNKLQIGPNNPVATNLFTDETLVKFYWLSLLLRLNWRSFGEQEDWVAMKW